MYTDLGHFETLLGLCFIIIFISYSLSKKFHWIIGLSYLYVGISNVIRTTYAVRFWSQFEFQDIVGFEATINDAMLFMTLIAIFFLISKWKHFENTFIFLALLDSIVMMYKFFYYSHTFYHGYIEPDDLSKTPFFLLNNSALDIAFVSCLIPFVLERKLWKILVPMVVICFMTKTSTGILGLCVSVFFYYVVKYKSWRILSIASIFGFLVSLAGYLMQKKVLFDSSGRIYNWKLAMTFWNRGINHWFGAGTGTFLIWGPTIQIMNAVASGQPNGSVISSFPTLHNDWLQILFENGIIGLVLALAIFTIALYKVRNKPAIFASLVTFGATAFIQMNLRWFLFAFFGAWLLTIAFKKEKPKSDEHAYIYKP